MLMRKITHLISKCVNSTSINYVGPVLSTLVKYSPDYLLRNTSKEGNGTFSLKINEIRSWRLTTGVFGLNRTRQTIGFFVFWLQNSMPYLTLFHYSFFTHVPVSYLKCFRYMLEAVMELGHLLVLRSCISAILQLQ